VTRHAHHSCRNRRCPQCQTRAKERWLAKRREERLPVPYFHQVFTLPHALHALVAGGALRSAGECKSPKRGFLFPLRTLSRVFRGKFIAPLSDARGAGQRLAEALADEKLWHALHQQLYGHDWAVYAKQPLGGPEQVLEYLGRCTHRVAISNERLVETDKTTVRFRVRATPGKRVLQ